MKKNKNRKSDCPINFALEIFGDKWTLLIIRDLMFKGKHYFGEFLQSEEKMATNTLADRLASLEYSGIVTKTVDEYHKSKQVYQLTQKGVDLLPILTEIILWSARHDSLSAADNDFVKKAQNDRESLFNDIISHLN